MAGATAPPVLDFLKQARASTAARMQQHGQPSLNDKTLAVAVLSQLELKQRLRVLSVSGSVLN